MQYNGYDINEVQLIGGGPNDRRDVVVQRRRQRDGSSLWVIKERSNVLNKQGEWELEPIPSSRTDAFIKRTRWAKLDKAIAAFWQLNKGATP